MEVIAISSDKSKLIRQLSLVAYLMSVGNRKASTWDIRRSVEEYADMSDQAFERRFYADRQELSRLGIKILSNEVDSRRGGLPESCFYWLPPENYFLPPIKFTREELAALSTCLCLLEGQFAYSDVLRLALQGLTLGTGNPMADPAPDYINVNLLSSGFDAAVAARLAKIETAIAKNKTICFNYHALSKDEIEERRVDPYALMLTRGDWYLVGHAHERDDIRVFKLRRIQGKIRYATKAEHDFHLPKNFDRRRYKYLEPWQLGPVKGKASIYVSPRISWWMERNLSHCGTVEYHEDGSATFITPYADGSQLCSLALGMAADAVIKKPAALRKLIVKYLKKIESLHTGKPPTLIAAAARQPAVRPPESTKSSQLRQVKPERFVKLSTLVAYLQQQLGEAETVILPIDCVCRDLGYKSPRELEKDLNLLLLVTFDTGYLVEAWVEGDNLRLERCVYGDLMKKPARLSPLEARALLLALDLVGDHLLAGRNCLLQSARQKIMQAAGGFSEDQAILVSETEKEDLSISQTIARGLEERRLVEIEYLSQEDDRPRTRRVEPYLLTHTKGEWYLVAYCLRARGERVFRYQMIKRATLLEETFKPRQIDLGMYRANPLLPSGCEAPFRARVLFSPEVARFVGEKQPSAELLDDGSLVDEIPYFSQNWLVREVLKYRGHAVVISPGELRGSIAETAYNLAKKYQ